MAARPQREAALCRASQVWLRGWGLGFRPQREAVLGRVSREWGLHTCVKGWRAGDRPAPLVTLVIQTHARTHARTKYMHAYIHTYTRTHARAHARTHVYIEIYMHACMCERRTCGARWAWRTAFLVRRRSRGEGPWGGDTVGRCRGEAE